MLKRLRFFFKNFLLNPRQTGALAPSSPFLAKRMIKNINFEKAKIIVELGPGDGAITKEILKYKKSHTKLILIEKNEHLAEILKTKFKDIILINDDAKNLSALIAKYHDGKVDYVISGLPFVCFPKNDRATILSEIQKILHKGTFIAFQYSIIMHKVIKEYFTIKNMGVTLLNFPPAFVYECINKKHK